MSDVEDESEHIEESLENEEQPVQEQQVPSDVKSKKSGRSIRSDKQIAALAKARETKLQKAKVKKESNQTSSAEGTFVARGRNPSKEATHETSSADEPIKEDQTSSDEEPIKEETPALQWIFKNKRLTYMI